MAGYGSESVLARGEASRCPASPEPRATKPRRFTWSVWTRSPSDEGNATLRNHLFVAMSRTRGWLSLTGVGDAPFYEEINDVLEETGTPAEDGAYTLSFSFARPITREMGDEQPDLFQRSSIATPPTF